MDAILVSMPVLIGIIAVALAFDMSNGVHDASNSIATVVSTGVLPPHVAVIWAAVFNFIAIALFEMHVAGTVGKGIVEASIIDPYVVLAALTGALAWNLITWRWGIPSSSSHALVGGLAGAGIAKGGLGALVASGFLKTAFAIVLSPTIGLFLALLLTVITSWMFVKSSHVFVDKIFRKVQLLSAALYSIGHGANDGQKTMGIIAALLLSQGYMDTFHVPLWVILSCQITLATGTLFGGWQIVKTMGSRITDLTPYQGACAETGGAITLFAATALGVPVSTTHTITGAIIGVGAARRTSAVRWALARRIVLAWVITIPAAGAIGALTYAFTRLFA